MEFPTGRSRATKVVVASTVMLSFISFWRAAAIVLCDLGSSAYYAGGIAESAVGKSAPWFILGIMLFSYGVRAVYVESCSMFVRGGVYRVVHEAMGPTLAKFAVSALLFDYVLTGPISGVSAGLYLAGLVNELAVYFHHPALKVNPPFFAVGLAVVATLYFWRKNIIGVHESSQKALRIMQLTTVMVVMLIIWCVVTMLVKGFQPVPLPSVQSLKLGSDALGWLKGSGLENIFFVAILVGLGHSLLAMSGEETLAQVNREIASPRLKNLERTGFVIFIYSLLFTSLVSFFAVMIIPDSARPAFLDNLIGGLSMFLVGPEWARLLFHCFVVVVGTILLAGAVNTAIIGSNGVLNRVAEDGVLPDSLRNLHPRFGTTHRMVNLIVGLQLLTLILTRGDILLLGEAYAFGVVTSFAMKSLSVLLLRFKMPEGREWKVPGNLKVGKVELPIGLGFITLVLFLLAAINLVTKKYATVLGLGFTLFFFAIFLISHKIHLRGQTGRKKEIEKFRLEESENVTEQAVSARPGCVLVAVRNPHLLDHVRKVLEKTDTRKLDIVVMTVKRITSAGSGEHSLTTDQVFSTDVAELFTRVVSLAEKAGKHVELLVVPGNDANLAIVQSAQRLKASLIVMGLSGRLTPDEQAKAFGDAWERLPAPRPQLSLEVYNRDSGRSIYFNLGPHPPRLWPQDVELLHELWLGLSERGPGHKLHHRDVVGVALRRLQRDLNSAREQEVLGEIQQESLLLRPESDDVESEDRIA